MGKNLLDLYENGSYEDYMDQEEAAAVRQKRQPKVKSGRQDSKRTKSSYISSNKKGRASQAALAAKWESENQKNQGRRDRSGSDLDLLEKEITGKRNRR